MHTALETTSTTMPGRPKKYGNEKTDSLSLRLPESVLLYLGKDGTAQREAAIQAIFFEKALSELTEDVLQELRISAALHGQSYDIDRAETISRLLKMALAAEKKLRK